eukprot:gene43992-55442_t
MGFVTFEYNESFARCLEDYTRFGSFPMSLFFPGKLRFKGKKLHVKRAPEPDQIIWENLEKQFRRFRTSLITVILVLLCFAVVVFASIYKTAELDS